MVNRPCLQPAVQVASRTLLRGMLLRRMLLRGMLLRGMLLSFSLLGWLVPERDRLLRFSILFALGCFLVVRPVRFAEVADGL